MKGADCDVKYTIKTGETAAVTTPRHPYTFPQINISMSSLRCTKKMTSSNSVLDNGLSSDDVNNTLHVMTTSVDGPCNLGQPVVGCLSPSPAPNIDFTSSLGSSLPVRKASGFLAETVS